MGQTERPASVVLEQADSVSPIVFAVSRAICEAGGSNPDRAPFGEAQSSWPMWMDHIRTAREALDRTAMMLRAVGQTEAAAYITKEIADA